MLLLLCKLLTIYKDHNLLIIEMLEAVLYPSLIGSNVGIIDQVIKPFFENLTYLGCCRLKIHSNKIVQLCLHSMLELSCQNQSFRPQKQRTTTQQLFSLYKRPLHLIYLDNYQVDRGEWLWHSWQTSRLRKPVTAVQTSPLKLFNLI